jgi:hypothetical protein
LRAGCQRECGHPRRWNVKPSPMVALIAHNAISHTCSHPNQN